MTRATKRQFHNGVAAFAALALAGGTLIAGAGGAGATPSATTHRIQGIDRYDTAAQLADATFGGGATNVVIASGDAAHFPDALAGNYLAGQLIAPILLTTNATATLPTATFNELAKLKPTNVYIVGGTSAVPDSQLTQLQNAGYTVTRLGGVDRFETDKLIGERPGSVVGLVSGLKTAIVANGQNFPDALSSGPLAFANHLPIVITSASSLTPTASTILKDLGIQQVIVVGGTNSVSAATEAAINALGIPTLVRLGGVDRSNTSQMIADWAISNAGFSDTTFTVATGDNSKNGADALAAGPFGGMSKTPVLVTNSTNDAGSVLAFIAQHAPSTTMIHILGGIASIPESIETHILAVAQNLPATQVYTLTPSTAMTVTVSTNGDNKGVVSYTATGLGTDPVDIALVADGQVSNGTFSFVGGATLADMATAGAGQITVVNGVSTGGVPHAYGVMPISGSVTFTVDSTTAGKAIPVVYSRADSNDTLSVDTTGVPTEKFGVGGEITWTVAGGTGASTPVAPTGVSVPAPADTSAVVTVTSGLAAGATVNAYIASGAGAFSTATKNASLATDADPGTPGFQIKVTGLTASTGYTVYVTQTVGGDESLPSTGVAFTTATFGLASATVADPNDGVDGPNPTNLVLKFSKAITGLDCSAVTIWPTLQPSTVYAASGTVGPVNTDTVTCPLAVQLHDASTDIEYTVKIAAGTVTTVDGSNAELMATFMY